MEELKMTQHELVGLFVEKMIRLGKVDKRIVGKANPTEVTMVHTTVGMHYGWSIPKSQQCDCGVPASENVWVEILESHGIYQFEIKTSKGLIRGNFFQFPCNGLNWLMLSPHTVKNLISVIRRLHLDGEKAFPEPCESCEMELDDPGADGPYGRNT